MIDFKKSVSICMNQYMRYCTYCISGECSGESAYFPESHQRLYCSHTQSMDVEKFSVETVLLNT